MNKTSKRPAGRPTSAGNGKSVLAPGGAGRAVAVKPKPASSRAERAADRRQAIIEAAFETFIQEGYAATRLDDVAKRAGVAKGTIYLHFKDKQALFEELVRSAIVPLASRLTALPPPTGSIRAVLENFAGNFVHEVTTTRRGALRRRPVERIRAARRPCRGEGGEQRDPFPCVCETLSGLRKQRNGVAL